MLTFLNNLSRNQIFLVLIVGMVLFLQFCQPSNNIEPSVIPPLMKEKFQTSPTYDHNHHHFSTPSEHLPDGKYLIVGSRNSKVCRDDPNGVICNNDFPTSDDYFTIQNADPAHKTYFIKGNRSNNWCSLTTTGVKCNMAMTDDHSLFRIEPLKQKGKYGIKNVITDKWCFESGYGLVCKANRLYDVDFEEFSFIPVRAPNIR